MENFNDKFENWIVGRLTGDLKLVISNLKIEYCDITLNTFFPNNSKSNSYILECLNGEYGIRSLENNDKTEYYVQDETIKKEMLFLYYIDSSLFDIDSFNSILKSRLTNDNLSQSFVDLLNCIEDYKKLIKKLISYDKTEGNSIICYKQYANSKVSKLLQELFGYLSLRYKAIFPNSLSTLEFKIPFKDDLWDYFEVEISLDDPKEVYFWDVAILHIKQIFLNAIFKQEFREKVKEIIETIFTCNEKSKKRKLSFFE